MMEARLNISVHVDCPECDYLIDLMSEHDTGDLNDEGFISKQALPNGCWHTKHKNFEADVKCRECGHEFQVKGLAW